MIAREEVQLQQRQLIIDNPYINNIEMISTYQHHSTISRLKYKPKELVIQTVAKRTTSTTRTRFLQRSIESINNPPHKKKENIPKGDLLTDTKEPGDFRFIHTNANGLNTTGGGLDLTKLTQICEGAKASDADGISVNEPNVNTRKHNEVTQPIKNEIRRYWTATKLNTAVAEDPSIDGQRQRGGTMTIIGGDHAG